MKYALTFVLALLAPLAASAAPCMPIEAGGYGTQLVRVDHRDEKAVIYTWLCNGQPAAAIGKYDWKPVQPVGAKALATELKRLIVMEANAHDPSLIPLRALAAEQRRLFAPEPKKTASPVA